MQPPSDCPDPLGPWLRLAALVLVVAALKLPINDLFRYLLLVLAALPIFAGDVSRRLGDWAATVAIVLMVVAGQFMFPAPRIEEGHNVFLVDGRGGALERGLPADAYRIMSAEFEARYPRERRCEAGGSACTVSAPARTFAFAADGIYDHPQYSRRVTGINFSDPVWLRLGFINDKQYNWYAGRGDLQRRAPVRGIGRLVHPWRLLMPYFVMYRFSAAFAGSQLCWQGELLWEGDGGKFTAWRHESVVMCRSIEQRDIGRMIFGVSISSPLTMSLVTPLAVQLRGLVEPGLALLGFAAVLLLLVRWQRRALKLPFIFIALAVVVVVLHDVSFLGGVRPFDGGDDGLYYEGTARNIVQHVLAGDFAAALTGDEKVFFYGGPGLRYLRALEHFIFGDGFLGYLSLILLLPFVVFALFKRFLSERAALALTLIFIAIPVEALFGSTYFQYVKWASRGFADPAAAVLFLAGAVVLVGPKVSVPGRRFAPACGAGLLFALALWVRPNLAPGVAVLLGGAGLAALWQLQIGRLAGLCIGFLPVLGMALHNWVFGGVFILFSSNANIAEALPMPPSAWLSAAAELLHLDLMGEHVRRGVLQIARWLAGPSESVLTAPFNAAAIAVLLRVGLRSGFESWLRLIAGAALALHAVALFYLSSGRYYYVNWLLTLLVCAVWMRDEGAGLLYQRWPQALQWFERHPTRASLARLLDRWMVATGLAPRT